MDEARTGGLLASGDAPSDRAPDDARPPLDEAVERARDGVADEIARRLEALDAATVAISQGESLDHVLQLIVDSVRPLVGARYAALGILDDQGSMERFVTSGISDEERRAIGHPPRGHGLLGLTVREDRPIRVDDISSDPRSYGFPSGHPTMRTFLGVPVRLQRRAIGRLYLADKEDGRAFDEDDERLVLSFARHAGLAIHDARLHEELRQLAVLQERERIAQDLHDGSIQSLYAVSLALEDTAELLESQPREAAERIEHAIETINDTIAGIRAFIMGLESDSPTSADLMVELAGLAEELERSSPIDVELSGRATILEPEATQQLVQLTREALSNVARHADATMVRISLDDRDGQLRLSISDDGRGFDTTQRPRAGHHGLANMQARAEALGGSLRIESHPGGTDVTVEIPRDDAGERKEAGP